MPYDSLDSGLADRRLTCVIVDDEPLARQGLAEYVGRIPMLECIGLCRDIDQLSALLSRTTPDIVFLDMEMPGTSGLEFLRTAPSSLCIVPVTAYSRYALDGFDHNVADFLLKPVSFNRFASAVEKVRAMQPSSPSVVLRDGRTLMRIPAKAILMLEAMENYVRVHTPARVITVRTTLRSLAASLPEGRFALVHKSYVVNLQAIETVETDTIRLTGGLTCPLARSHRIELTELLEMIWKTGK